VAAAHVAVEVEVAVEAEALEEVRALAVEAALAIPLAALPAFPAPAHVYRTSCALRRAMLRDSRGLAKRRLWAAQHKT